VVGTSLSTRVSGYTRILILSTLLGSWLAHFLALLILALVVDGE